MIIGIKRMCKLKMILNFVGSLITWDNIELSIKSDSYFDSPKKLCIAFIEATEPSGF